MIILLLIATFIVAFFIGFCASKKVKPKKQEISEEKKREFERTKKAFKELMAYDYDVALGGVKHE